MRVGEYDISRGDQFNIVLSKVAKHKKTGEEYLSQARYFSTWDAALFRALDLGINSEDVKEVLKEIRQTKKEIINELKKLKELK